MVVRRGAIPSGAVAHIPSARERAGSMWEVPGPRSAASVGEPHDVCGEARQHGAQLVSDSLSMLCRSIFRCRCVAPHRTSRGDLRRTRDRSGGERDIGERYRRTVRARARAGHELRAPDRRFAGPALGAVGHSVVQLPVVHDRASFRPPRREPPVAVLRQCLAGPVPPMAGWAVICPTLPSPRIVRVRRGFTSSSFHAKSTALQSLSSSESEVTTSLVATTEP